MFSSAVISGTFLNQLWPENFNKKKTLRSHKTIYAPEDSQKSYYYHVIQNLYSILNMRNSANLES